MATFYICRHGETENNKKKRLMGWIDTPLTRTGLRDAESIAAKLEGVQIDVIHSSDLGRAFMTAYLVSRILGYSGKIYPQPGLREVNYGDLANMRWDDIEDSDAVNDTDFLPPNGETLAQMQQRVIGCIQGLAEEFSDQTCLLASHDGVINALFAHFKAVDIGALMKQRFNPHDFVARFVVEDGSITSFDEV